jgi:hypothetical protein
LAAATTTVTGSTTDITGARATTPGCFPTATTTTTTAYCNINYVAVVDIKTHLSIAAAAT